MPPLAERVATMRRSRLRSRWLMKLADDVGAQAEAVLRLPVGERDRPARIALRVAILDRAQAR
jgi:hypothetical protein